ncbi:MAG: extracellular solute-binding protein [Hyphomicrobiaceae bacterium]|nr:extracellular solute-binding protein [Hyphomicrobiaceae bacterium]
MQAAEVNLYSFRDPERIAPLLRAFNAVTNIKVKLTYATKGLIERIANEGERSPADVLLTNEFGLLLDAQSRGLTQAIRSKVVEASVPATYRDPEGHWLGLTRRARVLVASKARVGAETITYDELADPKWKGRICVRSGKHPYNTTFVASMLVHHGAQRTEAWLNGVKANLARPPTGGDRDQIHAVIKGDCDVAIVNSYYAANLIAVDQQLREQKQTAIRVVFPEADGRGTHVSISGVALMKHAPNRDSGIKLIEFLTSELGQRILSAVNDEYPVTSTIDPPAVLAKWPPLKPDSVSLHKLAERRDEVQRLMDAVRFDNGPSD